MNQATSCARRRKKLLKVIGAGGMAILPTAPVRTRNSDVEYPFRGHSDFLYLTGFQEPEAVLVLVPGRREGAVILFCRERDPKQEIWVGKRAGCAGAVEVYGADQAYPIEQMDQLMPGLIEGCDRVYYNTGLDAGFDQRVLGWLGEIRARVRAGVVGPDALLCLDPLLHEQRLFKDAAEIKQLQYAVDVSVQAHHRLMKACRPRCMEYEMEAELLYEFTRQGCRSPAYPSIVASGGNACILHYTENSGRLQAGDLLLVDAGAEYGGYAADITRTIPVNGRFSEDQRAIYEIVLEAQKAAIVQLRPGRRWDAPHRAAVRVITRGLCRLGILKGEEKALIREKAYRRFFMHRTGHWLGMDVHDVGRYKVNGSWRTLEAGMVLTVEPGIYIPEGAAGVDARWQGIGVRIEDDVMVTETGHEVLSKAAVKSVADIEAMMVAAGQP